MLVKNTKQYYTEFYNFLAENNVRIGTVLRISNKNYIVLDGSDTYGDFELRISRLHKFPIKSNLYENSIHVKYSDIRTAEVVKHISIEVAEPVKHRYKRCLSNLKFIAELEAGLYYNREDNKVYVVVSVENDLNKGLYYELYDRDFKNSEEIVEFCKENGKSLLLEHMDFTFLVPFYGCYEKIERNKDLIAIGLKLKMIGRVI